MTMCSDPWTDRKAVLRPPRESTLPGLSIAAAPITMRVETCDNVRVLRLGGELDISSRSLVESWCTEGLKRHVVVELEDLTFLDCGGYRAFADARTALEQDHRTLTLVGAVGGPRRLLRLIHRIDLRTAPC